MRGIGKMIEERHLNSVKEVEELIKRCGLSVNGKVDYTTGIYCNGELAATGSLVGNMIQMMAVSPNHQGEDLASIVITNLIKHGFEAGETNFYLYTKPEKINKFLPLGFNLVASAKPYTSLLEWGRPGIEEYCHHIKILGEKSGDHASAMVMNCNPFTLGHRYLIERAAAESSHVFVLVVEEDISIFPFDVRLRLIRQGTIDLPNVTVIPGGRYTISSLTFPSYFMKNNQLASAHSAIDVEIFLKHIAPSLNVKKRYIGTEPFSIVTQIYNKTMKERLIPAGIAVTELPRMELSGIAVSASHVRSLLSYGNIKATREFVPLTTYNYLISGQAIPVLNKIKLI